jgi:hypothetical protein
LKLEIAHTLVGFSHPREPLCLHQERIVISTEGGASAAAVEKIRFSTHAFSLPKPRRFTCTRLYPEHIKRS